MSRRFLTPPQLPSGTSLPSAGAAGALFFKSDESKIYVHTGTEWVVAQGSGGSGGGVIVSATAPADPDEGTYWFDSTTAKSYIYYDSSWVEVGYSGGGYIISENAPANPTEGDVWFSTSEGVIYVYYDNFWVDPTTGGAAGVPVGGTTGQVLAKTSGDDYDTEWVDPTSAISSLTDVELTDVADGETLVYNASTGVWENGLIESGSSTTVSETAPTGPEEGDTWFKSSTGQHFIYYDSYWVELGVGPAGPAGADGKYSVSATAPTNPQEGDTWFNSELARMFIYYDNFWVETGVSVAGERGPSGVVAATAPITYNAETQTVGINQSGLTLSQSQITGLETTLSGKQSTITGGATTIVSDNLTTARALVSDSSGKVSVSAITATELGYLDDVTSNVQTQLNGLVSRTNGTVTTASTSSTVVRNITLSTGDPSGGTDGDVWLKYTA